MSLLETWAPLFYGPTRLRGRSYFKDGRVTRQPLGEDEVARAIVRGSENYLVTLSHDDDEVTPTCTCPDFKKGNYCKHIYAVLMDLQENGPYEGADIEPAESGSAPAMPKAKRREEGVRRSLRSEPEWATRLTLLRPSGGNQLPNVLLPEQKLVTYHILPHRCREHNALILQVRQRTPIRSGWGKSREMKISRDTVTQLPTETDRQICGLLLGSLGIDEDDLYPRWTSERGHGMFRVPATIQRNLMERLCETRRCFMDVEEAERPLTWDRSEGTWTLWLKATERDQGYRFQLQLRRDQRDLDVDEPKVVLGGPSGILIYRQMVMPFDDNRAYRWVQQFREDRNRFSHREAIEVDRPDLRRFLDRLFLLPHLPNLDFPESLPRPFQRVVPVPVMQIHSPERQGNNNNGSATRGNLKAQIRFRYGDVDVHPQQPGRYVGVHLQPVGDDEETPSNDPNQMGLGFSTDDNSAPEGDEATVIERDLDFEKEALSLLPELGFRTNSVADEDDLLLPGERLGEAVNRLIIGGWDVTADRRALRRPGTMRLSIVSGIDWFDLKGGVRFETDDGEEIVSLPDILRAARSGRAMITLSDGSEGLLPEEWLKSHGLLTAVGEVEDEFVRFKNSQAALLDAMLAEQDLEAVDEKFAAARERLRQFKQVQPINAGEKFKGELRSYQRDGLGWLGFLRWFSMGGILADDMGLGKTIQVLAMLDRLYLSKPKEEEKELADMFPQSQRPTLVVAPRSVVYNWLDEAKRFTPKLKVLSYSGTERDSLRARFDNQHLIITSYGLLRRDIEDLVNYEFEYVILDEAQAIKNPSSQGAKAARLLRAENRLALTGTPVENHLGDLWSIFEFLNPGMLGASSQFSEMLRVGVNDPRSVEVAKQTGESLRPFILRRTKKQVLDDLPEKTEQTIVCEMDSRQRAIYDQLREHYRGTLMKQLDNTPGDASVGGSAMLVLEALLRLRQAACHPALIDPARADAPSAKLESLLAQVEELIDEGHKALIFSQFTSFLALVRKALDKKGIRYEYLDGSTRDRKKPVEHFQNDDSVPLFLISLKAGGLGLNLTAAEYVFILDPWWNPAVEQQAIDRAHRIGQQNHVFAYRLICEDTVEQRIAELQEKKRDLSDAIVGEQENLLRSLTRDDLEALLR